MKRASLIVLAAVLLSSCVAETVERHRPRRGPVKEVGYIDFGGGQVRYSSEGWSWIVASRRKTALKLMSRNCGPDLKPAITDEYSRQDADAVYSGEDVDSSLKSGLEHYHIEHYIHLAYECRPLNAPAVSTAAVQGRTVVVVPEISTTTALAAVEASTSAVVAVSSAPAPAPAASSSTLVTPEIPR